MNREDVAEQRTTPNKAFGPEFLVEEAVGIVFEGRIPVGRPEDAHDILGTYRLAADPADARRVPKSAQDTIEILKSRHAVVMGGRPAQQPGHFKDRPNRAGRTVFVAPDLVDGTLDRGFELCRSLETTFARAVFMMFLVSEVHPFADGNGRTARLMMNAELSAEGEERIIIPTIYRTNYLAALKALSQNALPTPVVRTLDFAQRWTAAVTWSRVEETRRLLESCHAFLGPDDAESRGLRLRLP